MTTPSSSPTGRRSSWRRKLLLGTGGLLLLLVLAYFLLTSSAFFKGVILPRASKAVGAEITVGDASISPFSQVKLRQLTVKTTGTEPLLQAEEVQLRYSLFAILRGTLKVDEITVVSPVVQIIENADGTSNLDPLLKKESKPGPEPTSQPSKPSQIDLRNLTLKNATVRRIKNLKEAGPEVTELTAVNITLDQLKNGESGKLTIAAAFNMTRPPGDVLEGKSTGLIDFTLGSDLMPQTLKAKVEQEILRAEGSLRELADFRSQLTGDITPLEVKELSQRFLRAGQLLGEVKVTGPLDLSKKEGRLRLEAASIDRQVLNLIGAPFGLDFGATTLNSTTELTITQGGSAIAATTRVNLAKFSVTQEGQTTPPLDLQWACDVTVNTASESARVQTFTLEGTQAQKPLLRGSLTKPMDIAWGENTAPAGDSAFAVVVTDFDLAAWKPFLGETVSAGRMSLQFNLISEQGGKQLKLDLTSRIDDLAANLGAAPLTQAALQLQLTGQVNDFRKVNLPNYRLSLTQQAQPTLTVTGSAGYDGAAFNLQTQIEVVLARLLGSGSSTPLNLGLALDGSFTNQVLNLRQMQLTLAPTPRAPKNEMGLTGRLDLSDSATTKGLLTVQADTLDLTQLYDALTEETNPALKPAATPSSPASTSAPTPSGDLEPEPVVLPLELTAEANLRQIYLREIDLQNCQLTAKVAGSRITLDPFQLSLNGAPANANLDLDLSVKGYRYALSLLLDKVPLEPIANTFSPADRGKYQGLILANAQLNGAGLTGASLQKNLSGQARVSLTNANLQLIGPKTRKIIVPIAILLRVDSITQSPLNWLEAETELGGGNINLKKFAVQSEAFEATTAGVIPIAAVLTNSPLDLPVEFALRRSLAEKANLLPPNTPTDATYAMLPQFVTVKGTVGEPKSDLNKLALGGLLLQSGVGIAEKLGVKVDPKASNLLESVGNLLPGRKTAGNTNQPATNPPAKFNPLDLFKKK